MEWTDSGFILATRRHGETSLIVEAFTPAHGRHLGLVKGGRSARLRAVLQPGNRARLTWRARLSEHLGHFTVEAEGSRAADIIRAVSIRPKRPRGAWPRKMFSATESSSKRTVS